MLFMALSFIPATTFAATEIGDVEIESVTFNYNPGDTPKATAEPMDIWYDLYNVEYECWEETETNEEGVSVPVKYWYSGKKNDAVSADKRITTFEEEAKEDKITTSNPKTRDTSNVLVWASLIATSALTMFGITAYAKKKKSIA